MEGNDEVLLGEIEGPMCLRLTGDKRKTQVTAVVTQDHKQKHVRGAPYHPPTQGKIERLASDAQEPHPA